MNERKLPERKLSKVNKRRCCGFRPVNNPSQTVQCTLGFKFWSSFGGSSCIIYAIGDRCSGSWRKLNTQTFWMAFCPQSQKIKDHTQEWSLIIRPNAPLQDCKKAAAEVHLLESGKAPIKCGWAGKGKGRTSISWLKCFLEKNVWVTISTRTDWNKDIIP